MSKGRYNISIVPRIWDKCKENGHNMSNLITKLLEPISTIPSNKIKPSDILKSKINVLKNQFKEYELKAKITKEELDQYVKECDKMVVVEEKKEKDKKQVCVICKKKDMKKGLELYEGFNICIMCKYDVKQGKKLLPNQQTN